MQDLETHDERRYLEEEKDSHSLHQARVVQQEEVRVNVHNLMDGCEAEAEVSLCGNARPCA